MTHVILFGGGDGGGLIITENGIRPIPPFDPALRFQLKGISGLLNGIKRLHNKTSHEMGTLVTRITNLIIEQVEAVVGPLDGNHALVYQDDDGGFSCGSTGKPPIPFPWPPHEYPSFNELVTTGILEHELVNFISAVGNRGKKILEVLENPHVAAKELGVKLSEKSVNDLRRLAPSQLDKIADPVDREIVEFFHKVAEDGRFLSTWASRPYEASEALQIKLSDRAFERIFAGSSSTILDPGMVMNPVAVAVAVGIVIMLVDRRRGTPEISDFSGISKF